MQHHTAALIPRCVHGPQGVPQWPEVQEAVAKLCLAWWTADAPGKEALVAQTLPYLLLRALATGGPRGNQLLIQQESPDTVTTAMKGRRRLLPA